MTGTATVLLSKTLPNQSLTPRERCQVFLRAGNVDVSGKLVKSKFCKEVIQRLLRYARMDVTIGEHFLDRGLYDRPLRNLVLTLEPREGVPKGYALFFGEL